MRSMQAGVVTTCADIAEAGYADSLTTAQALQAAVDAPPTRVRAAWIAARAPYKQTEAFRFGNPSVDAWESRVTADPRQGVLIALTGLGTLA